MQRLGLGPSTEWVKLSFKNLTWKLNLHWESGKGYLDRKWYGLARGGRLKEGDTLVFQMTGKPQKYEITVYESDLLSRCNISGTYVLSTCSVTINALEYIFDK